MFLELPITRISKNNFNGAGHIFVLHVEWRIYIEKVRLRYYKVTFGIKIETRLIVR